MPGERTSRKRELTELFIKSAKADKGREDHRDAKVQGLVLRVSASGATTFAVMMRDDKGQPQAYTLGRYPDLSLKEARAQADVLRHGVRVQGVAPTIGAKRGAARPISLRDLLAEAQPVLAKTRKGWKPRGPNGKNGNAYGTILAVFRPLLDHAVESLDETDIAAVVLAHRRSRPHETQDTTNGQVSRAMSYLPTVFDWAAGRGRSPTSSSCSPCVG